MRFLEEALESCKAQTHDEIEIILSQNPHSNAGITKSIYEWCVAAARDDSRIKVRANEINVGVAENCNLIADAASGEYVIFIGDDDRLLSDGVEKLVALSDTGDVVFGNHLIINEDGEVQKEKSNLYHDHFRRSSIRSSRLSALEAEQAAWDVAVSPASALVKTAVFRSARYQSNLIKEDTEFFIRLASQGASFVYCPDVVSEIRHHSDRITESIHGFGDLALALLDKTVSPEVEATRARAMSILTRQGVGDFMLNGRWEEAKKIINSPDYPRFSLRGIVQLFCLRWMPRFLGWPLYKGIYSLIRPENVSHKADKLGREAMPI